MVWSSEITHIKEYEYFIDEQKLGPYKLWHHLHRLKKHNDGVLMTDIINYALPFGIIGYIAYAVLIKNKLKEIFDYRREKFDEIFNGQ